MRRIVSVLVLLLITVSLGFSQEKIKGYEKNWPQWRGPEATGAALTGNPPTEWSETKNVKWKIEIPGKGHATPIVWGDQIFVSTAVETDKTGEKKAEESKDQPRGGGMSPNKTDKICKFEVLSIDRN